MFSFTDLDHRTEHIMRLLAILMALFFFSPCRAQPKKGLKDRWRNSIGVSVHMLSNRGGVSPAFGVFYNPQINIIDAFTDFSLAVTMPMTLGAHVKTSFVEHTFFYGLVPAVLEANIGHYSTRDFRSGIGMGFGAGYGAQFTDLGLSSGFDATLSVRTWIVRSSFTIRYVLYLPLQGNGYQTHSIAVAMNMGNYFNKLINLNKISKFQDFK